MDELLKQNEELHEQADKCRQQLKELRKVGEHYETKIQTLLKFNQKLLSIIEKEINGKKLNNSSLSLQPISEKTELESELELFQSQFQVEKGRSSHYSQKLMQGKSWNIKSQSENSRVDAGEPMAIIEREEQVSIDVDGEKERESEDSKNQVMNLIREFYRSIKKNGRELTFNEMDKMCKTEQENLGELKKQWEEIVRVRLEKLGKIKQEIVSFNARDKIMGILKEQKTGNEVKNIIGSQLEGL